MEYKLEKNKVILIKGEANIEIKSGKVAIVGGEFTIGKKVHIPVGKTIPLNAMEDSLINIETETEEEIKEIENTIPGEWDKVADKILEKGIRKVLMLGEMDTGKTFFTTYIANRLFSKGKKVAVLDCDIGQSDIGPPCALGMANLEENIVFLSEVPVDKLYFLGSHSPGLHLAFFLTGIEKLVREALKENDIVLVDTTGWVMGDGGRNCKRAKIMLVQPDLVAMLQRENELEHLVKGINPEKLARIKVSKKASFTPPEERKLLREHISKQYFKDSKKHIIDLNDVDFDRTYLKTGVKLEQNVSEKIVWMEKMHRFEPVLAVVEEDLTEEENRKLQDFLKCRYRIIKAGEEKGVILGLCDENSNTLALGICEKIDYKNNKIEIYAPLENLSNIKIIEFGSIRYKPNGEENGFIEPGTL